MNTKDFELKSKLKAQKRFGNLLVKLRKEKGITPAELGRRCFMERSNIAKIEGGDANVTLYTMIKLANALDISLEELLKGFENKK